MRCPNERHFGNAAGKVKEPLGGHCATGDGAHNHKGLCPRRNRIGQRSIWWFLGHIPFTGEEPQERPPLKRGVVADRSAQHRIACFERVQNRTLCDLPFDLDLNLPVNAGEFT